jgi:hypothetical protein
MKKLFLVFLLIALFALVGCQALTASADGDVSLEDFLLLLTTGPGIGVILSVALEKIPFLKRLFDMVEDMEVKRLIVLAACVLLAVGAQELLYRFGYIAVLDKDALFAALSAAWEAFTASTLVHGLIRQ